MIISRETWKANPASLPSVPMRLPATQVFIHHTVSPVSDDPFADMRMIEKIGLQRFGQFSYSFVVHPHDGEILEGAGLMRGAHTAGRNSTSFAISWCGNYEERQPKVQQLDATRRLIARLTAEGHLVPGALIRPHRDVFSTACPGSKLYAMLDVIRHPWEPNVPDDPSLPNLPDIAGFYPIINSTTGMSNGYYILSSDGQLHAFGPGAVYFGRSEVPSP